MLSDISVGSFWAPHTSGLAPSIILGVAKKSGVTMWNRLFYTAFNLTDRVVDQPQWLSQTKTGRTFKPSYVMNNSSIFIITPNPYARFFSVSGSSADLYG
ncbi:hypothetical protein N9O24_00495 [bacterium]|nr:hypothetical protein [bacterium]